MMGAIAGARDTLGLLGPFTRKPSLKISRSSVLFSVTTHLLRHTGWRPIE